VPDYHHARAQPTDVQVLVPRTYHADGMLLYCDAADQPVLTVALEVQRGWDPSKQWTWKLYVAQLESELEVNAALLVYCPDPTIARRYRGMFEFEGLSLSLRPFIVTPHDVPLLVDVELARANPALAVFSAICHGGDADVDAVFPALAEALRTLGPKKAILYYPASGYRMGPLDHEPAPSGLTTPGELRIWAPHRRFATIASAAARPATSVFGQEAYPDLASKAAALLHSICCNHPLIDGNKRVAWTAVVVFVNLKILNIDAPIPDVDVDRAKAFMLAVANGSLTEVPVIAAELRRLGVTD
jgi:prophage maintenance system killer protein